MLLFLWVSWLPLFTSVHPTRPTYIRSSSSPSSSFERNATISSLSEFSSPLDAVGEDISILPPSSGVTKIVMKFGGSSLATPERIVYVSKLIKKHVELGYRPIIVCSAMGKTTNTLLSAGDFALNGQIYVDSLRTLHMSVAKALRLSNATLDYLTALLDELERLLEGVKYIGELSPR
jgi:aspartate kinase